MSHVETRLKNCYHSYDMNVKFSVVIPVRAINDFIREAFPHLINIDYPDYEVLIFPDELPDQSVLDELSNPRVRIIASGKTGPAQKRDMAMKYATGNVFAFIDDDAFPRQDWLKNAEKWFGDIAPGVRNPHRYWQERPSGYGRRKEMRRPVPDDMLFKSWLMPARTAPDYCAYDLLSDILGTGQSSYLYRKFVVEDRLFTDLSASVSGTADPGLFLIGGRPAEGVAIEKADELLSEYLYDFQFDDRLPYDLQKVKNNAESVILERSLRVEDRANTLATGEFYSRAEDFADERTGYFAVTGDDIRRITDTMFRKEYANTLYYRKAE